MGTSGYSFMMKNKNPMTFAELSGIKIRNPGGYLASALKASVMVPVTIVPAEVYDAMAKGLVEAACWSRSALSDFKQTLSPALVSSGFPPSRE